MELAKLGLRVGNKNMFELEPKDSKFTHKTVPGLYKPTRSALPIVSGVY